MGKVLIVYGSVTGNTEGIAQAIAGHLEKAGHEVSLRNAADVKSPKGLAAGFDAVLLGCSAWGDDEIELQGDFAPLADAFGEMGLNGRNLAAFASGDSSYPHFCGAVDVIEANGRAAGANIVVDGLRVEGDASSAPDDIRAFAGAVAGVLPA